MAAQPPKADEPDPVEALRKRVGTDDKPKVKVGGEGNKCDPNDPLCGAGL